MKKLFLTKIPFFISFLLQLYIVGLVIFTVLRIVLLIYSADESIQIFAPVTFCAFKIGLQFDTVVLAYALVLPLLLLFIQSIIRLRNKIIPYFVTIYLSTVFPLLIFLTIADIPYFKFFHNRLSESSLQWLGDIGIVLDMVIGSKDNVIFLALAFVLTFLICYFLIKFCKNKLIQHNWDTKYYKYNSPIMSSIFLVFLFLTFLGMRGKTSCPIRQGDAFYCTNPILNQIGLNPAFTLLKSYSNKVNLMDNGEAIKNTLQLLHIKSPIVTISPFAREVKNDTAMKKFNIVLVLMEGMSANYMGVFGNQNNLTPTLDSLSKVSWFFKNAYSAGIHTNNGIFPPCFRFLLSSEFVR